MSTNSIDAGTGLRSKQRGAPPLVKESGPSGGEIGMYPERRAQGVDGGGVEGEDGKGYPK